MDAGGARIEGQRLFEHRDRALVVAPRERRLAQARQHRDVAGRQLRRALEQRLGLVGLSLLEIQTSEPDQRGDLRGIALERARERLNRLLRLADALVQMTEVVRPPRVAGHQILRVQIRGLGRLVVLGGVQQHRVLAVRVAELVARGARLLLLHQRRVALLDLCLHGRIHAREIGQDDLARRGRRRCAAPTASTNRTPRRARAAHRWRVVPSLALSLPCALGQRGPAIDGHLAELLGLAARPAHAQTHGIGGRTKPDQHARIVGRRVAAVGSRAPPQRSRRSCESPRRARRACRAGVRRRPRDAGQASGSCCRCC